MIKDHFKSLFATWRRIRDERKQDKRNQGVLADHQQADINRKRRRASLNGGLRL